MTGGSSAGGGSAGGGGAVPDAGPIDPPMCAAGLSLCGVSCTNPRTDLNNCGRCGNACAGGQYCNNGTCAVLPTNCATIGCPTNFYCDTTRAECVFGCTGNANCSGGQTCDLSRSVCACPATTNFCGGSCVPQNTVTACGSRCLSCGGGPNSIPSCTNGVCDFTCQAGFHRCGNACVSNFNVNSCGTTSCAACPQPPNATATCDGTSCSFTCSTGFHACGADCVSNFDVATCGSQCTPCTPPANATAACTTGVSCDFTCNPGFVRCGAQCVQESATACGPTCQRCTTPAGATNPQCVNGACTFSCATGFHQCGTSCVSNTAVATCGTLCTACPAPVGGVATCDGTSCGVQCSPGFHECNGQCVSNLNINTCGTRCTACPPGPVGSGTTTTCDGVNCGLRCATTTTPNYCNNVCVADSLTSCGPSCLTCTPPANGTAVCVTGTCDFTCNSGFHRCGTQCVADSSVDGCGTSCTPCAAGPANSTRTCARGTPTGPFVCGWTCASGTNRCPAGGNQCVPADYVLGCGPTCAICGSANANERGVCPPNGLCTTACVTNCGGACVNAQTNVTHCGTCNNTCTSGERCSQGECKSLCASGVGFRTMLPALSGVSSSSFPFLVVDVNGDNRPDLVTAEFTTLNVRLGLVAGFSPTVSTTTSMSITPTFLVAGDLTGDGRPEVVAIGSSASAAVMRNSGAGTFSQTLITANPLASLVPTSVTIGEFTGAAPNDVIFGFNTTNASQAAILFPGVAGTAGSPVGTGTSASLGLGVISNVRAANITPDGFTDLIVTAASNAIYVFPGTGVGSAPFNSSAAILVQLPAAETFNGLSGVTFPMEVADVTNDGVPDVIVPTLSGTSGARVFPLTTAPAFAASTAFALPAPAKVIIAADVTGDTKADVALGSTDLRVFPATSGTFGAVLVIGVTLTSTSAQSLALVDITQDTLPDVVTQSGSTMVTVPNEAGSYPALQGASVPSGDRLVAGDLNGDGLSDAVVTPAVAAGAMNAQIFFGSSTGALVTGPVIPVRSDRAAVGRLNADAVDDLVTIGAQGDAGIPDAGLGPASPDIRLIVSSTTATSVTGRIEVLRSGTWGTVCDDGWNDSTIPTTTSINNVAVTCRSLGYAATGGRVLPSPSILPGTLPTISDNVMCLGTEATLQQCSQNAVGNENCDNSEDVVVTCSSIGVAPPTPTAIEVRFGSTSGTLSPPVLLSTPTSATLVAISDLDGDGAADVIASTNTTLGWFRNLGSNTFAALAPIAPNGASSVAFADVNNDGRRDVIAVDASFSTITPWLNVVGGFVSATPVTVSGGIGANLAAVDLTNDSKIDLVLGPRLLRGDGSGGFVSQATLPTLPIRQAVVDLDNDGAPDLAAAGSGSSVLSVLRGDLLSTSTFSTTPLSFSAGTPVADVVSARLNTDAQRDLLVLQGPVGARFVVPLPGICR